MKQTSEMDKQENNNIRDVGEGKRGDPGVVLDYKNNINTLQKEEPGLEKLEKLEKGLQRQKSCEVCDFETAITATGYGRYNCLLMAASLFGFLSSVFATSTMSLILPSAGCELHLTNVDKGTLNAVIYIGMIISAFVWGFLSDTLGRKKLLMVGFALEAFCSTVVGLAQDFNTLLIAKLFSGFISSGPYAIYMSYLAESHATKYRPSILVWTGIFSAVGTVGLPALAWLIIPQTMRFNLFDGLITLPSWRIFLLVSTIPSFIGCGLLWFFDESPKFLMSKGRREEALVVFQNIYHINTRRPRDTYPIKHLVDEKKLLPDNSKKCNEPQHQQTQQHTLVGFLNLGWQQVHPLFTKPHLAYALLVFTIQFGSLYGLNTIRLWTPQLFSSMMENEKLAGEGLVVSTVCQLLADNVNMTSSNSSNSSSLQLGEEYEEIACGQVEDRVYINSIIIGLTTGLGYFTSGYLVRVMGNKWLMEVSYVIGGVCCISMYWAITSDIMLVINCIYVTVMSVAATAIVSVVVDLFPTSLRTMAVSLTMMFGRVGAMTGNLVFPILLDWNCSVPFFLLSAVIFATGLITLLLPRTKGRALQ